MITSKFTRWMVNGAALTALLGLSMLPPSSLTANAQTPRPPVRNVSRKRHPNLAAAQRLAARAYQRILDAQKANEWDMDGHAQKAKDLLDQANSELKLASQTANKK